MELENEYKKANILSDDQHNAYTRCMKGENVFITGPGGCGKSYLINHIVKGFKNTHRKVQVCAMTGCAAILLECNACTLHSWSGIGLARDEAYKIATRIELNKFKRKKWKETEVLILDEVSMLSKELFEILNFIGQKIRKNALPFGGIQLIFSGDFYQLPPVGNKGNQESFMFCFESPHWKTTFDAQILLDEVFRQKDTEYIELLHQVREGTISKKNVNILENRIKKPPHICVMLVSRRNMAEDINKKNLDALDTMPRMFSYTSKYEPEGFITPRSSQKELKQEEEYIVKHSLFDKQMTLKIGARVMSIVNLDLENGICNGSTGVVVDFDPMRRGAPVVQFDNGIKMTVGTHEWKSENIKGFTLKCIPLILAWAITIHKSQGSTLDYVYMDLGSNVFADGQTYVALSRVKSLQGLYLSSFNPRKIRANQSVSSFYEQFYE